MIKYGTLLVDYIENIIYENGERRKTYLDKTGHIYLSYKSKTTYLHRLVAEIFYGPCPEWLEVRHLDGNPRNNYPSNLKYGTRSENVKDMYLHWFNMKNNHFIVKNPFKWKFWKDHNTSKRIYQYSKNGELLKEFWSVREASRETTISNSSISACARWFRYKSAGGFVWKYEK